MEVSAPGVTVGCGGGSRGEGCCRGGVGEEGKERSGKDRMAQVVPVDDAAAAKEEDLMVPYVVAVDDSSVDRAVITALLRRSKYRGNVFPCGDLDHCSVSKSHDLVGCLSLFRPKVTAVDSGKRALEILDSEPNVSMIITDYWMPEMTGYDLLKRVKESSELRQIPVVIMSSENVPTRITRCLEEGAEEFLLKPVRPSDISRISTRMLQ